jgi:hypothetical protein
MLAHVDKKVLCTLAFTSAAACFYQGMGGPNLTKRQSVKGGILCCLEE